MTNGQAINLEELDLFQGLSALTLGALRACAYERILRPGEALYQQGDQATAFYVVEEGGIRLVEQTYEGKSVNIKIYGPGDIFGLLSISGKHIHDAAAITPDHSKILCFNGQDVRQLMHIHPEFAVRVIDCLVDHVHHAHSRIRQLAVERVEKRLAQALLRFHAKFGHEAEGTYRIDANITQKDFAEFTGTTLESVNRVFRKWSDAGYLEVQRRQIDILRPDQLHEIAQQPMENDMSSHLE